MKSICLIFFVLVHAYYLPPKQSNVSYFCHGEAFSFSFGCLLFHCGYYVGIPYILQLVSICVYLHLFIASHDASFKKRSPNPTQNLDILHGLIIDIEHSNVFYINIYNVPLHFLVQFLVYF